MKKALPAFLAVVLFYGALQLLGITCPIKFVTGISCPGCGMTRAWLSLLFRQDLTTAFHYHPLFWGVIPALLLYLFRERIPEKLRRTVFSLLLVLYVGVYFYRLFSPGDTITVFRPEDGLIFRFIRLALNRLNMF